jgi:hypothetical protein
MALYKKGVMKGCFLSFLKKLIQLHDANIEKKLYLCDWKGKKAGIKRFVALEILMK